MMLDKIKKLAEADGYLCTFSDERLKIQYLVEDLGWDGKHAKMFAGSAWVDGDQLMMMLGRRIPHAEIRKVDSPEEFMRIIKARYPVTIRGNLE